jgi:hypothetical protein
LYKAKPENVVRVCVDQFDSEEITGSESVYTTIVHIENKCLFGRWDNLGVWWTMYYGDTNNLKRM